MSYEKETRAGYQSSQRAEAYKKFQTRQYTWGRISTWLEQRIVRRMLAEGTSGSKGRLLDAPCGTGILGPTLMTGGGGIVAADIAMEMMELARDEYPPGRLLGFTQADITSLPFPPASFDFVVTLGFMHRVPAAIRQGALAEIFRVSSARAILSFSHTSLLQLLKHRLLRALSSGHVPASSAVPPITAIREIESAGFTIKSAVAIAPFLSSETLYLVEKADME